MKRALMHSMIVRGIAAGALALLLGTEVAAQIGLGDVGAASAIRADLESGTTGPKKKKPAPAATTPAAAVPDANAAPIQPKAAPKRDKWGDQHSILRNPNPSVSWLKLLPIVALLLAWVRSGDWVNRDAQVFSLGHEQWNLIMVLPFVVASILMLIVPFYPVTLALMVLAWIVPLGLYVLKHNASVEQHQKVFTSGWFRYQIGLLGNKMGLKIGTEKQAGYLKGPPVDLMAMGGDERENKANLLTARQSPGYVLVKELVFDMVERNSSRAMLDYTQEAVLMRHLIDGVWHNADPRDRESGDVLLAVVKQLCNLSASERRKKQSGSFYAEYLKKKYACQVVSQGVKSGERVVVSLLGGRQRDLTTYDHIGMREKLCEQWNEVMNLDMGVVIYSAMPEGGLTTLTDVGLLETDRLIRDVFAIEDVADKQRTIENIEPYFYDRAAGESPITHLRAISLKYPNVYVCRDLVNPESAKGLLDEVLNEERLLITTVHAKEAPEALLRLLQKKVPHKEFAEAVSAVLNTRLVRLLCDECKIGYAPSPDLLKKLGIPAGKVDKLYRSPKGDEIDKPCKACRGIGFRGRTGLFEMLIVNDQVREVLLKQPKLELLRKASRAAGMRTLQEEGVLLVAKGMTSLPELSRVLKA